MGSLPPVFRILKEDVPGAPDWIELLLVPINFFFQSVYLTLNKQVDNNNLANQIKELSFTTPADYDSGDFTSLKFRSNLSNKSQNLQISQITEKSNTYLPIKEATTAAWREINGEVFVDFITGLKPLTSYVVKFIIT